MRWEDFDLDRVLFHGGRALLLGLAMTVYGYFAGWVRFAYENPVPPVWLQLLRIFGIWFAVSMAVQLAADAVRCLISSRREKKTGKN